MKKLAWRICNAASAQQVSMVMSAADPGAMLITL